MSTVLKIQGLSKRYGRTNALKSLDLEVEKGEIFGLLGPNGSGKTTTLGIILGAINQNAGNFQWFEEEDEIQARLRIGSILEQPSFYHYLSAEDNLKVVCAIKRTPYSRIDEVLERVDLLKRKQDAFKTYSLGMKQRLAIASSLIADPEVLILDEPTNGLDPQGIAEIRELIIELGKEGRTIILASHLLDEVQKICSKFAVLKSGQKIFQGSVGDLDAENSFVELKSADSDKLYMALQESNLTLNIKKQVDVLEVQLIEGISLETLHKFLIDRGIVLNLLQPQPNRLEKKFLEVLREGDND